MHRLACQVITDRPADPAPRVLRWIFVGIVVPACMVFSACGGSDSASTPSAGIPEVLEFPEELVPAARTLYLNAGPASAGGRFGWTTGRQWFVLDTDGTWLGTTRTLNFLGIHPQGNWRLDDETLRLTVSAAGGSGSTTDDAQPLAFRQEWRGPGNELYLRPRARIAESFYIRRWADPGGSHLSPLLHEYVDPDKRQCADGERATFSWQGFLELGEDRRYLSTLKLMRECRSVPPEALSGGHALGRLTTGSWEVIGEGRQIVFIPEDGERTVARLDGATLSADAPNIRLCIEGALLGGAGSPEAAIAHVTPRSILPIRSNVPLLLDEDVGCSGNTRVSDKRSKAQAWLALGADGTAEYGNWSDEPDVDDAVWSASAGELIVMSPADSHRFMRRWAGLVSEPNLSATDLLGVWDARSYNTTGLLDNQFSLWTGSLELLPDGIYHASLRIDRVSGSNQNSIGFEPAHPFEALASGYWSFDDKRGELTLDDRGGALLVVRTSVESPDISETITRLGMSTPRLQIDGVQFVRSGS